MVVGFFLLAGVAGVGAVLLPSLVLPLGLEGLVLLLVTAFIVSLERDPSLRAWLTGLVAGALGVRLLVMVWVHFSLSPYLFAPDAQGYEFYGRAIRDHWLGLRPGVGRIEGSWQAAYHYINGLAFYVFGENATLGPVVLNVFVAVWTAVLAFHLGRRIRGEGTGKALALLVAFFPSLILWSVLNIRDALTTFLVVLATLAVVHARERSAAANGLLALVALVVLSTFRDYMGLLVGVGLGFGLLVAARPGKIFRTLAAGVVLVIGLALLAETSGVLQRFPVERPFDTVTELRQDMTRGAGSAFAEEVEFGGPADALAFLPLGVAFFLFAPFPWAVNSLLQMAALPETLLWYALVPFTLTGMIAVLKERRPGALLILSVAVIVTAAYSLVEGNVGTAYRHRAQIMPLLFFFTAVGMQRWWARRKARWKRRKRMRSRVRSGPELAGEIGRKRRTGR